MSQFTATTDGGTTTFNYVVISQTQKSANKAETLYRDDSSSLETPRALRHSVEIDSKGGVDRHLVQFTRTDEDADGVPHTGSVHCVIAAPRDGVSTANLTDEWNKLKYLIDQEITNLLGGFPPLD